MTNETTSEAATPVPLTAFEWVYATAAGMFYPSVAAGNRVEQGATVGTVGSLFGDTLETITAPATGRVLFLTVNPAVKAGGLLMGIGVED